MNRPHWTHGKRFKPGYLMTREGIFNMYIWLPERASIRAANRGEDWESARDRAKAWIVQRYIHVLGPRLAKWAADYRVALEVRRECGDDMKAFKRRIDEISRERAA